MKKILLTIVLLATFCLSGQALEYYIQGDSHFYSQTATNGNNRMNNLTSNGITRYWFAQQITVTAEEVTNGTPIKFRVRRTGGNNTYPNGYFTYDSFYAYDNTTNTPSQENPATLYFAEAGTYWVVFTIDHGNDPSSLYAVVAKISGDQGGSSLWPEQVMTFSNEDQKFHFHPEEDMFVSQAVYNGKFKVHAYHRKTTDEGGVEFGLVEYGTEGEAGGDYITVNFPDVCKYEMDISFDPIWRTTPTCTVKGFYDLTIGNSGYSTLSHNMALDVPGSVKAYFVCKDSEGNLKSVPTHNVPRTNSSPQEGTGVIVQGAANTYRFYRSANQSASDIPTGNLLSGNGNSACAVGNSETYCFTKHGNTVGFFSAKAGTYSAFKAFLPASEVSSSREFIALSFGNEETAISTIEAPQHVGTYYNLQGQPVAHPTKGLYILNGRKVMVR